MIKRIITAILICLTIALSFTACGSSPVNVNVENDNAINGTVFGRSAMIEIGNRLWYDSTTRIVYWWNGYFDAYSSTSPSPYYAPNGLPYRYNPETNTFEEIKEDNHNNDT